MDVIKTTEIRDRHTGEFVIVYNIFYKRAGHYDTIVIYEGGKYNTVRKTKAEIGTEKTSYHVRK